MGPFGPIGIVLTLLGAIALVGMVVRNSVILVAQIETEIAHGGSKWTAVVEATAPGQVSSDSTS